MSVAHKNHGGAACELYCCKRFLRSGATGAPQPQYSVTRTFYSSSYYWILRLTGSVFNVYCKSTAGTFSFTGYMINYVS